MIYSPKDSLGNWWARHQVSPGALAQQPKVKSGDVIADPLRKAAVIAQEPQNAYSEKSGNHTFMLYDDGTHGDLKAADKIYAYLFADTKTPGTYAVDITATGDTSMGQPFRRQRLMQRHVEVAVDKASSEIQLNRLGTAPPAFIDYRLTLTPKDNWGNFLGPGHSERIAFFIKQAIWLSGVEDHLNGRYSQRFRLPEAAQRGCVPVRTRVSEVDMQFCLRVQQD